MAAGTILQFLPRDIYFVVFFLNISRLMFVAAVASVFNISADVACLTNALIFFAVIQREDMLYHPRRVPGRGCVATLALQTKKPGVNFWFGMALPALACCTPKNLVAMTAFAGHINMLLIEREKIIVLKIA